MSNNQFPKGQLLFIAILLLGAFFRFYGLNWDQNQHLHPDERMLIMVTGNISLPRDISLTELLTPKSPLNPHFFAYGSFPIYLLKFSAFLASFVDPKWQSYDHLTLLGRGISATFDLGTILLLSLTTGKVLSGSFRQYPQLFNLVPPLFYALSVFPIQASHFFAVDSFLTFFVLLTLYFCLIFYEKRSLLSATLVGVSLGLSLATKVSALILLVPVGTALMLEAIFLVRKRVNVKKIVLELLVSLSFLVAITLIAFLTFAALEPYALIDKATFVKQIKEQSRMTHDAFTFPFTLQYVGTTPYLYHLKNVVPWGMGWPLGVLAVIATLYTGFYLSKGFFLEYGDRWAKFIILFSFFLTYFLIVGKFAVKFMRYFLPLYPPFFIFASFFLFQLQRKFNKAKVAVTLLPGVVLVLVVSASFLWVVSFISIYSHPHSRIQASRWIYENIPPGSTISCEHWDDCLPLGLPNYTNTYKHLEFPLYGEDTPEKWREMEEKLKRVDYIVMSSNRLYGSITGVPWKYPATSRYYQRLFDGSLGFAKVAEITSRPNLPLPWLKVCLTPPWNGYGKIAKKVQECNEPGITFVDDYADESFTVYDHPKVLVFRRL